MGLGSNAGNRPRLIDDAVERLHALGTGVVRSPLYETAPVGGPPQGDFLNAVAVFDTDVPAPDLLDALLAIEGDFGRVRGERWGPRIIDLDLLLYGDEVIDGVGITVPHPRMADRRFVIEPLLDVWPDATLPDGRPVAALRAGVADQQVAPFDESFSGRASWVAVAVVIAGATAIWWLFDWVTGLMR